ncbi:MAG: EamA family transporter RarD [Acidobacteriota bacterium]
MPPTRPEPLDPIVPAGVTAPVPEVCDAPLAPETIPAGSEARSGFFYGLAAYLFWGLSIFYFKSLGRVAPPEILAHRILWSVPLLFGWLAVRGRLGDLRAVLRTPRTVGILLVTTLLIGTNWLVFITAVESGRVVQSSLGYYINPLLNVVLGMVFLGERLRPVQWMSVALAAIGVLYLALSLGSVPFISLILAVTFGLYGLLRKTVPADGPVGLAVETGLLLPVVLVFLLVRAARGEMAFLHVSRQVDVLLLLAGLVTTVPLLWFTNAVRRLRLATVGFLQYLSPSLQLLIAVAVYGEPFTRTHLVTFSCIWAALGLYSADALRRR